MSRNKGYIYVPTGAICIPDKKYGFFHFLWDAFMTVITCGLWLIWIFVREMRNR